MDILKQRRGISSVIWVIAIFVASFVVLWPLARPGFFISDDGEWMIIRLSAFYQSLAEGQFPVRFLGRLNQSYGYPVANFLYPGFLYIGSVIHRIGFSFVDSIKVIVAGSVVGTALALFFGLRQRHKPVSSFIGTLGFLFMPYLLFDLYKRGSVGEILAMFAAALAWFSMSSRKAWILPWAVALLLVSHNSLALLFFFLIVGYLLVERMMQYLRPLLLGVGMSAFFWFPAVYERRYVFFDALRIADPSAYFIDVNMLYLLNIVPIAAAIILFTSRQKRTASRSLHFFLGTFAAGTLLATPMMSVLWQQPILAKLFQFPYRFLSIGAIAGPWLVAAALERVKQHARLGLCLLFAATWVIPWWITTQAVDPVVREEGYYTTNEATTTVANEYMPRWVYVAPQQRAERSVEFFLGKGTIAVAAHSTQQIDAVIEAEEQSVIQINTIYYPGWGVQLDGLPAAVDYRNIGGVMRVNVPNGRHHITAEFRETVPRFVADMVSLAAAVFAIIFSFWELTKKRGEKP